MPNPFAHIELNTSSLPAAKKFYSALFDWDVKPYPGGDESYLAIATGSRATGGGMQESPMPEAPPAWLPYVGVESVKKTLARAQKLGAKVVLPYQPIGELGAIGVFTDPAGAALGVWEEPKPRKQPRKKAKRKAQR